MTSTPVKATAGGFPPLGEPSLSQTEEDQRVLKNIRKTWQSSHQYWSADVRNTILNNLKHVHATKSNRRQPSSHIIWKNNPWNLGHWVIMVGIYGAERLSMMKTALTKNYPDINFDEIRVPPMGSDEPTDDDAWVNPPGSMTPNAPSNPLPRPPRQKPRKRSAVAPAQPQRSSNRLKKFHAVEQQEKPNNDALPEDGHNTEGTQRSVDKSTGGEGDPFVVDEEQQHIRQAIFGKRIAEMLARDEQQSMADGRQSEGFSHQRPISARASGSSQNQSNINAPQHPPVDAVRNSTSFNIRAPQHPPVDAVRNSTSFNIRAPQHPPVDAVRNSTSFNTRAPQHPVDAVRESTSFNTRAPQHPPVDAVRESTSFNTHAPQHPPVDAVRNSTSFNTHALQHPPVDAVRESTSFNTHALQHPPVDAVRESTSFNTHALRHPPVDAVNDSVTFNTHHPPGHRSVETHREGGPEAWEAAQRFPSPAPPPMGYAPPAVHTRQVTHGDSSSPSPFAEPVKFEAWDSPAESSTRRLEGTPAPWTNTRYIQPTTHEPGKREMMVEDRHSSPTAFTNPPSAKPWTSATGFNSHSNSRASPTPAAMGHVQPTAYEGTQRTIVGAHHTSSPTIVNPPTTAAFHQRSGVEESPNSVFSSPLAQEPLVPGADLQSPSGQRASSAADEVSASSPISVRSKRRLTRGQTRPSEIDSMAVARLQRHFDEKIHAIEQKHAQQMQSLRADHAKEILDLKFSFQTRMVNLEERFARFEEAAMGIDDDD